MKRTKHSLSIKKSKERGERFVELCDTIIGCYTDAKKIPIELIKEYNEMVDDIRENQIYDIVFETPDGKKVIIAH